LIRYSTLSIPKQRKKIDSAFLIFRLGKEQLSERNRGSAGETKGGYESTSMADSTAQTDVLGIGDIVVEEPESESLINSQPEDAFEIMTARDP
jgi:hypothetical protein